jgi:hypothetical protein
MNAGLAKLIHAIWFIRASAVDLDQSDAAALFHGLASWLRDHPSLAGRHEIIALHNQKISTRGTLKISIDGRISSRRSRVAFAGLPWAAQRSAPVQIHARQRQR